MSENKLMSLYDSVKPTSGKTITVENYIGFVQHGANQDLVLKARAIKAKGDEKAYIAIKKTSKVVTGSCTISDGKPKTESNIETMNGLIVIDVDDDQVTKDKRRAIKNDKYTYIMHESFGGGGNYCVFIKIDSERFLDSFHGISDYYYQMFGITIDQSCKNKNRLRYLSYDPDIYVNEKSNKFIPKDVKRFREIPKREVEYVFHKDDFDAVLEQIRDRNIDLCQEDYFRYVRIGMAFANEFGESGRDKFHFVCQFGGKYNQKTADRDYNGFLKSNDGRCQIGTFYYYCKESGIEIYTDRTKAIINRVKISKSQGVPTVDSIVQNLNVINRIEPTKDDLALIDALIKSPIDFSRKANESLTEIEQLANFIVDSFNPTEDAISLRRYINGKPQDRDSFNDIYLACKKHLPFKLQKGDVEAILYSSYTKTHNTLQKFLRDQEIAQGDETIREYIQCIEPFSEYNLWAFKKWIVSAIHNWVSDYNEKNVSPLTLVLTGNQHGSGKTSFFRNLLPDDLGRYFVEGKINAENKDTIFLLATSLMVIDDEFGGKAFKDEKEYKSISDTNWITQRRPYGKDIETFKRRAILGGSSNELDILKDVTGNRRILPIKVEKINYDKMVSINTSRLIMEAYNLYKDGFQWQIFSIEDMEYIKENSSESQVVLPVEELFFKYFRLEKDTYFTEERIMNQGDLLDFLIANSKMNPTKFDLKDVVVKNKMKYGSHRVAGEEGVKKGFKLYMRPANGYNVEPEEYPF